MENGFISIRNQDGTSWYCGYGMWGPKSSCRPFGVEEFVSLQLHAPRTTKGNNPDDGYFGLMNLKWHPCTVEEAVAAEVRANYADIEVDTGWCIKLHEDSHAHYFRTMCEVDEFIDGGSPPLDAYDIKSFDEALAAGWQMDMPQTKKAV